jgi:hypothetical protein
VQRRHSNAKKECELEKSHEDDNACHYGGDGRVNAGCFFASECDRINVL